MRRTYSKPERLIGSPRDARHLILGEDTQQGIQSESDAGILHLIALPSPIPATIDLYTPPAGTRRISGRGPGQRFGMAHALGDFDGDGKIDLAAGAPLGGANEGKTRHGVVYVFYGGNPALEAAQGLALYADAKITGPGEDSQFGHWMAAGDFNGDGYDDLVATTVSPSAVYVLFGGPRARPWRSP